MFEQDEGSNLAISVAIGVAVIFAVVFVLGLLCGLFGLILNVTEQVGFAGPSMLTLL
ncbi:MAG TPA: hypothetical protein VGD99_19805 [Anaerolineae bacterium]|jgi:hypothetical protein